MTQRRTLGRLMERGTLPCCQPLSSLPCPSRRWGFPRPPHLVATRASGPQCRLKGSGGEVLVRSQHELTPGERYRTWCRRQGSNVPLRVVRLSDQASWSRTVSRDLNALRFASSTPVSASAKLAGPSQFAGGSTLSSTVASTGYSLTSGDLGGRPCPVGVTAKARLAPFPASQTPTWSTPMTTPDTPPGVRLASGCVPVARMSG